jgi:SecD/SecF fusion protein
VLAHWKERETVYARRRSRLLADGGIVSAYAVATAGAPADVMQDDGPRRAARRLTQPDDPQRGVSRDEFDAMVRDLNVDAPRTATATPDPAADLDSEDLVLKDDKPKREKRRGPRNKRHGRSGGR